MIHAYLRPDALTLTSMMQSRTEKYAIDATASFVIGTIFSYRLTPAFSWQIPQIYGHNSDSHPMQREREDDQVQMHKRKNVGDLEYLTDRHLDRCRDHPSRRTGGEFPPSTNGWNWRNCDDQWDDRPITWKFPWRERKLIDLRTNVTYSITHPPPLLCCSS